MQTTEKTIPFNYENSVKNIEYFLIKGKNPKELLIQ